MNEDADSPTANRIRGFSDSEVHPRRVETRRLASAARHLLEHLVRTDAPDAAIASLADDVQRIADELAALPQRSHYEGFSESANSGDPHAFFDDSPMIGQSNPLAPPIVLTMHDDRVEGAATFGSPYEGPPGCVHGGYVAAAFDEVLGTTQSLSGAPGMTGRLTVHYRKPTPLHRPLRFVGRLDRVDGRKIFTTGQLFDGETLTAEAEGLFISIDFAKFAEMRRARDEAQDG